MKGHSVITGAAGFIGSHLTDRLLADGQSVVGIDSFEDYYPRAVKEANLEGVRANPAFTLHEANIMDEAFWVGVYPGLTGEMLEYAAQQICPACGRRGHGGSLAGAAP